MGRVIPLRTERPHRHLGAVDGTTRSREALGVVLLALGLFFLLSVVSLALNEGNLMGPVGLWVGTVAYAGLGVGSLLLAGALLLWGVRCLRGQRPVLQPSGGAAFAVSCAATVLLVHLAFASMRLRGMPPGGALGEYGAEMLRALVGTAGTALVALTALSLSVLLGTSLSFRSVGAALWPRFTAAMGLVRRGLRVLFPTEEQTQEQQQEADPGERTAPAPPPRRGRRGRDAAVHGVPIVSPEMLAATCDRALEQRQEQQAQSEDHGPEARPSAPAPVIALRTPRRAVAPAATEAEEPQGTADDSLAGAPTLVDVVEPPAEGAAATQDDDKPAPAAPGESPPPTPAVPIIEPARPSRPPPRPEYIRLAGQYELPSIDLLDYKDQGQGDLDRQAMLDLAHRLEKTLLDYQVRGRVSQIHPGPVVTMYEFVPAPGIKLSKITALSSDLAMTLEALRVRIVAPIPGKAAVGIEVPNKVRETVYLKEILADEAFTRARSKLTLALGKDISGMPVCVDLAKMPHLLVAGTTGSGKSVSINAMVASLLFSASPDEVKMIMIDPKMLELSIYEGIPHLLLPVVTDPKKANLALKWAVDEMERRYDLISKAGVRDIASYNRKIERLLEERPQLAAQGPRHITITVPGADGTEHKVQVMPSEEAVRAAGGVVTEQVRREISAAVAENEARRERLEQEELPRKLPYIVVLIDEFADLMMVAAKEVETSVARIAQKARAAGIHLILATQRPSVDVITGLIKANFPSRLAFQVASRIDSRTILDTQGAESLLGMGDMLFMDRGQALRRIHGALITDSEIHRLVEHLKRQGQPIYDMDILKPRGEDEGEEPEEDFHDEMYEQAVRLVLETRQASISMIQRRLRIGYNRAARMIERMEREGLVSPADGAKGREVLANCL